MSQASRSYQFADGQRSVMVLMEGEEPVSGTFTRMSEFRSNDRR